MNWRLLFFLVPIVLTACERAPYDSKNKELRISVDSEPTSLDPRIGGTRKTQTVIRMLYEGLGRYDRNGNVVLGIADSYEFSDDFRKVTFHLRDSVWSNGEPLTADDFVQAWKEVLDPQFATTFAHCYYIFKNGEAAKKGLVPLDQIGLEVKDDKTILIEFENPCPQFLEVATNPLFSPVYRGDPDDNLVSNGSFILAEWNPKEEIKVIKNPNYWNSDAVKIGGINIAIVEDSNTAFLMWERGEIDMIGGPMSSFPLEAISLMKEKGKLETYPSGGVYWLAFNTGKPPFNSVKVRKAFAYAIDRRGLVDNLLQGGESPSTSILPQFLSLQNAPYFRDANFKEARNLFEEGLKELGLTRKDLGSVELNFVSNREEKTIAQALQQKWTEVFQIPIQLSSTDRSLYLTKASNHDYQVRTATWYPSFSSPGYNMDFLKSKEDRINMTQWENSQFRDYLELAEKESNPNKRKEYFRHAERTLLSEMPLAPIFYHTFKLVKHDNIHGFVISETGYPDFKWITIN